ncbi:MAG: NUDIX hydrolase, partial [Candidatus Vogelbacteria bacterium]|nr:NUDIX hydrolase [Candidatus Vogelbacteria bacterium]
LPVGRLDPRESLEQCVVREGKEETGLDLKIVKQLKTYSDPNRDPRGQKVSTIFLCTATGRFHSGEPDRTKVVFIDIDPASLSSYRKDFAFDHYEILVENYNEILSLINNSDDSPYREHLC